jgi:hypothetical protein
MLQLIFIYDVVRGGIMTVGGVLYFIWHVCQKLTARSDKSFKEIISESYDWDIFHRRRGRNE